MWTKVQQEPDDDAPFFYHGIIKDQCLERLRKQSPQAASLLLSIGDDFGARLRYLANGLRIWFVPNIARTLGFERSLAEDPCPKDKWYSPSDIMAFSYPLLPDDQMGETPTSLFGPWSWVQERYADPEVQGGKIAVIAVKQNRVQKPPNGLDRMRTTFLKQTAYNQRVLEAEQEIAGINCDIAEFLSEMSLDPVDQIVICVNGSEPMKRGEEAVGGQLWMQGDRKMTVSNTVLDGMENTKESAILSAADEAVTWRNAAMELTEQRKGQRVVICPKELTGLHEALSTGNPNVGEEDGHPIAYAQIMHESQKFENPPLFLRADCDQIVSDPVWAEKVP
jgi:hypothetical protein